MKKKFNFKHPETLVNKITRYLVNEIVKGEIRSGKRLIEKELQIKFKSSRSPIRESFRILEEKGLIVNNPRKGTYVRTISKKDINDNFPITANLEAMAARLAIQHLKQNDIREMELNLSKMREAGRNNNFENYLKYHYKFNDTFINASKNDILIGILKNLRHQLSWFRGHYFYVKESYNYALKVHSEILKLFKKKDVDRLEVLIKEHAFVALKRFIQSIDNIDKG